MDPLSVTASIIAVFQALKAVTVGIQLLVDLRKVPAEYLDLHNEVCGFVLRALLTLPWVINLVPTQIMPSIHLVCS